MKTIHPIATVNKAAHLDEKTVNIIDELNSEIAAHKSELAKIVDLLKNSIANNGSKKTYDLKELQEILKVSRRTIATWTHEGTLPHSKKGNKIWITEEQLNQFLDEHSNNTTTDYRIRKGKS